MYGISTSGITQLANCNAASHDIFFSMRLLERNTRWILSGSTVILFMLGFGVAKVQKILLPALYVSYREDTARCRAGNLYLILLGNLRRYSINLLSRTSFFITYDTGEELGTLELHGVLLRMMVDQWTIYFNKRISGIDIFIVGYLLNK